MKEDVLDILPRGNIDVKNVEAFVLSHWHFDHNGNIAALPKACKLMVGPGFKEAFLPGYPAKEDSPFHEADFQGREVIEPPFSDDFKVGKFQAHDYFGDGSFYVGSLISREHLLTRKCFVFPVPEISNTGAI